MRRIHLVALDGNGGTITTRTLRTVLTDRGVEVVDADTTEGLAAAMASAGTRAAVSGRARSSRRGVAVALEVRDARGEVVDSVEMRVRDTRSIERLADRLERAMAPLFTNDAPAPSAAATDAEAAPSTATTATPASPSTTSPAEVGEGAPPIRAVLTVGAGVRSRDVELLTPSAVDVGYHADAYAELAARAELWVFGIGFARAFFASSVGLSSQREEARLGDVDTLYVRAGGDIGAAYSDRFIRVGAAFGVGWERYQLAFNELLPTAEYVHLRPAVLLGVRLVGDYLQLDLEGAVRVPFGVGDLESVYGVQHRVIGADGIARLYSVIDPGLFLGVELAVHRYWLTFQQVDGEVSGFDGGIHVTGYAGWRL